MRINGVHTQWCHGDVIEVVTGAGANLDVIIIPKVKSPRDVWFVDDLLTQLETKLGLEVGRIGLELLIEETEALACVEEIAACSPRLEAIILGVGDLSASQGLAKLDDAELAAAAEESAKDVAADLRRQVIEHAAETPSRNRARAAWEQQTDAIEQRAFAAIADASDASDAAYQARAGLPADRSEWAQMRQRAQAALGDIDRRLEDARREDAAERDRLQATVTRIREQEKTVGGELTQLNAEHYIRQARTQQHDQERPRGQEHDPARTSADRSVDRER